MGFSLQLVNFVKHKTTKALHNLFVSIQRDDKWLTLIPLKFYMFSCSQNQSFNRAKQTIKKPDRETPFSAGFFMLLR